MYVTRGGESERGARARRLPAAAAARLAGGVAPARGPRERRRRSARGAHTPTWTVPPGPGGTWRDRRDLDFWRDRRDPEIKGCLFRAEEGPELLGWGRAREREKRARWRRWQFARSPLAERGHWQCISAPASRGATITTSSARRIARRSSVGRWRRGGQRCQSSPCQRRASSWRGRRVELPAGLQERREAGEAGAQEGEGGGGGAARCSATEMCGRRCAAVVGGSAAGGDGLGLRGFGFGRAVGRRAPRAAGAQEAHAPDALLGFRTAGVGRGRGSGGRHAARAAAESARAQPERAAALPTPAVARVRGRADSCRRRCHDVRRGWRHAVPDGAVDRALLQVAARAARERWPVQAVRGRSHCAWAGWHAARSGRVRVSERERGTGRDRGERE